MGEGDSGRPGHQEPREGAGRSSSRVLCTWGPSSVCLPGMGQWGLQPSSVSSLSSGLEVDSASVCAIWLLLCMQEPSFAGCMKSHPPRSPPPGFVFPKRGESSFEHSSLWIVLSLIHAVPIPPVFLPRLRDIPKELEGREGGFFLFGSGQEGARCFGKARGSNRKRVPATVCLTSLRLLLWLHVPLVLRSLLPYSCHKERTGKPLGIRLD